MTIDWESLRKTIPTRIHVARGVHYEIVWIEKDPNRNVLGETRFDTHQIILELGNSDKGTVITYLHELAHAISGEYDLALTETQVLKLEKSFHYLLKANNFFKQ